MKISNNVHNTIVLGVAVALILGIFPILGIFVPHETMPNSLPGRINAVAEKVLKSTPIFAAIHQAPFKAHGFEAILLRCSDGRYGDNTRRSVREALKTTSYDDISVPGGGACNRGSVASGRPGVRIPSSGNFEECAPQQGRHSSRPHKRLRGRLRGNGSQIPRTQGHGTGCRVAKAYRGPVQGSAGSPGAVPGVEGCSFGHQTRDDRRERMGQSLSDSLSERHFVCVVVKNARQRSLIGTCRARSFYVAISELSGNGRALLLRVQP